jgi:nucleotide-binding universal stress UspA family protein
MMNARQIVVGFDGSESSRLALTWAMRAAKARRLPVLLAHVGVAGIASVGASHTLSEGTHDALMQAEQAMLTAATHEARRETPGVEVTSTIVTGIPVDALLGVLTDAELVVVGSRGLGAFTELLVGSTSLQLATYAPCPVVVVRSSEYVPPGAEAGRVVVGVDGSSGSAQALEFAFQEASLRGCGLTAVYAWEVPSVEAYGWLRVPPPENILPVYERDARRVLAESLAGWTEKFPDVDVHRLAVHAAPVAALVAASAGAEVVVVGSRGMGGFRSLLIGSVGHGVLHHAHCPVAVVRRSNSEGRL